MNSSVATFAAPEPARSAGITRRSQPGSSEARIARELEAAPRAVEARTAHASERVPRSTTTGTLDGNSVLRVPLPTWSAETPPWAPGRIALVRGAADHPRDNYRGGSKSRVRR